jgi:DNA-binding winged helix-turn-helix (wHTH) protein/tetratricopeptide (TPR) repeat protein
MDKNLKKEHIKLSQSTGEVTLNGTTCHLRPKTFLLAEYLIKREGQVISKEELLESVWEGSFVEEQAVFQSVNEIRKAFSPTEVIKTYPRRGYEWVQPKQQEQDAVNSNDGIFITGQPERTKKFTCSKLFLFNIMLTLLLSTGLLYWLVTDQTNTDPIAASHQRLAPINHQALLVLPFDTSKLNQSERWLRFGAMEAVILGFAASEHFTPFRVPDVLDILTRVPDEKLEPQALFEVSAATHIVEAQISGVPGEYYVAYSLFKANTRQQGGLHAQTIEELLALLVDKLATELKTDKAPERLTFNIQFNDALMFNAIQLLSTNDLPSAITFLQSAISDKPDNLVAHFLLAKAYAESGKFQAVVDAAERGFLEAKQHALEGVYLSRLAFIKGTSLLALGDDQAYTWLQQAQQDSAQNEDWLYAAYAKTMLAHYHINQGEHSKALPLLQQSLSYQQMLGCPMGEAQGYLDFVDYYIATNNTKMAMSSYEIAKALVHKKHLQQVEPLLKAQATKINTLLGSAEL